MKTQFFLLGYLCGGLRPKSSNRCIAAILRKMNRFCFLSILAAITAGAASAQRVIYDQARDKTAQDAETAAKQIASASLFDKMLRNVDLQAKYEIDTTMAFLQQQMRAKIQNFTYWSNPDDVPVKVLSQNPPIFGLQQCKSVECELQSLEIKIKTFQAGATPSERSQLDRQLQELEEKKEALDRALKDLQASSKSQDPAVVRAFSLIEDNGKDLIDYAKKVSQFADSSGHPIAGLSTALNQIGDGLDEMLSLYNAVKSIWEGHKAISVEPSSLRPPQEQIDLELLAVEQDHIKTISLIRAREFAELSVSLNRVQTALSRLEKAGVRGSRDKVEDTLAEVTHAHKRERLSFLLNALHESAAAAAEEDAAGRIAELKLADEQRRYAIRRSAVNSRTYEQTIQAASQRLSLYWKSGIKPAELAQLVFYIANTTGVSIIAANQ